MTRLHVLRVFMGPDGRGGNPLGVFLDGRSIPPPRRQAVAAELDFSETVWVDAVDDDQCAATIRFFTPGIEMPFAGHPMRWDVLAAPRGRTRCPPPASPGRRCRDKA